MHGGGGLVLLSVVACIWTTEAAEQWKNLGVGQGLASGLMRWKGWWWWDGSLGTESREWGSSAAGGSLTCSDWCGPHWSSRSQLELEGRAAHGEEDGVGGLGQWNGSWGTESRWQGSSASMGQLLRR